VLPVDSLSRAVTLAPEQIAVDARGLQLSYRQLECNARAMACGFAASGVQRGATVALLLPAGGVFVQAVYGAWMNDNLVVPFSDPGRLIDFLCGNVVAAVIVGESTLRELEVGLWFAEGPPKIFVVGDPGGHLPFDRLLESGASDAAHSPQGSARALLHSGLEQRLGDVVLTHDNMAAQVEACRELLALSSGDRWLQASPGSDPFALLMTLTCIDAGATVVVRQDVDLDVRALAAHLRDERITLFADRFRSLRRLLDHQCDYHRNAELRLPRLRRCVELGEFASNDFRRYIELGLGAPVYRGFFLREAGLVCCNRRATFEADSAGPVHRSLRVRIEDDEGRALSRDENGRILLQGSSVGTAGAEDNAARGLRSRVPDWHVTARYGRFALDGSLVRGSGPAKRPEQGMGNARFANAVREHGAKALGMLLRMGISKVDVEAIAVSVFLRAHGRFTDFDGTPFDRVWLYEACREAARFYLHGTNQPNALWRRWLNEGQAEEKARPRDPRALAFASFLCQLPDDQMDVFILHEIEELPLGDVATLRRCSLGEVAKLHRIARRKLVARCRRSLGT